MGRSIGRSRWRSSSNGYEPLKLRRGPWLPSGSSGPAIRPVEGNWCRCHIATRQFFLGAMVMVEPGSPLLAFSDHTAELVERVAGSIVAVDGGGRWPSSGIHWRSGVIVTAEEVLERDENIKLTLPGGRVANASLAGRDPPLMWLCFVCSRTDSRWRRPPMPDCAL